MLKDILKFFKRQENSKDLAKERLKLVLVHDKANVSPQFLEMVKGEIIEVIKKYMEIDEESLDIQLTKEKSDSGDRIVPALIANIPIINVKPGVELRFKKENDQEKTAKNKEETAKAETVKNEKKEENLKVSSTKTKSKKTKAKG